MDLIHIRRHRLKLLLTFITIGVAGGIVYGMTVTHLLGETKLLHGALRGAFTGFVIAGLISSFELFVVERPRNGLRSLPFLQLLAIKEVVYIAIILGGDWLGSTLFAIGDSSRFGFNNLTIMTFFFSIGSALLINFVIEMSVLLGPGVLKDLIRGRYHRPRRERRLLVFFDMRGSTAIAEKIGDMAYHSLLNRFFIDLTEPVLAWRGIVHKYVGDEMIVTWPLENGRDASGAYAAVLAARKRFALLRDDYQREFGVAPDFRAVLHAGEVVAGEMGEVKREIALLGDTVNTTAKIEGVAKTLAEPVLASIDALNAAVLPSGVRSRLLGSFSLPGKLAPVELHSIEAI